MNEEEKLIKEQWDKLSPELRGAIESVPWKGLISEIGRNNALSVEQAVLLERETMFVLYGFENPRDYVANIAREVGISEEQALTVAEAVAEKIFEPVSQKAEMGTGDNKNNLPMVEKGEIAHDVPHVETENKQPPTINEPEKQKGVPLPDYRYPDGTDPYREPLA